MQGLELLPLGQKVATAPPPVPDLPIPPQGCCTEQEILERQAHTRCKAPHKRKAVS